MPFFSSFSHSICWGWVVGTAYCCYRPLLWPCTEMTAFSHFCRFRYSVWTRVTTFFRLKHVWILSDGTNGRTISLCISYYMDMVEKTNLCFLIWNKTDKCRKRKCNKTLLPPTHTNLFNYRLRKCNFMHTHTRCTANKVHFNHLITLENVEFLFFSLSSFWWGIAERERVNIASIASIHFYDKIASIEPIEPNRETHFGLFTKACFYFCTASESFK